MIAMILKIETLMMIHRFYLCLCRNLGRQVRVRRSETSIVNRMKDDTFGLLNALLSVLGVREGLAREHCANCSQRRLLAFGPHGATHVLDTTSGT